MVTLHGPASITVTGTAVPSASNTWVIPTLRPKRPLRPVFSGRPLSPANAFTAIFIAVETATPNLHHEWHRSD